MKIKEFNYKKKNGEQRKAEVVVLVDSENYLEGIDFTKLTQDERSEVVRIQAEYEEKIKPFISKAFRKFLKEGILNE
jgi:hypothetical protein